MSAAVEAPARRQDQPEALSHLDDVLELARLQEPAWSPMQRELRRSGALLNDGEEGEEQEETEEPTSEADHSGESENQDGGGNEESFTDFDLDSLPAEARGAAQAAMKRMQADYTRKTQTAAEKAREAEQYRAIVEGLEDPERAPEILRILGYDYEDDEALLEDDDELIERDPRVDQLEARFAEREHLEAIRAQEEDEDHTIAEQIETLEKDSEQEFSEEEIGFIYLYADEYRDERGQPNVKAAVDLLEGIVASRQQAWVKSKKTPRRMRSGRPASRQVDLSKESREDRITRMAEAAEAARGSAQ